MMNDQTISYLRTLHRRLRSSTERLVWGGERRERVLLSLLGAHYESLFRRLWVFGTEEQHFTNHRIVAFRVAYANQAEGPEYFYRGFFSSELLEKTDRMLDIGCGDGFFTKRFFASRCASIDAVDIEPSAIATALRYNNAPNINYLRMDAVNDPFPADKYDVVVWDGAIGHFATEQTTVMLAKIAAALSPNGVFSGSESLGMEGHDHLQFFESLDDMAALFRPFWKYVSLREVQYPINKGSFLRREGYWRCANDRSRLDAHGWKTFSTT